MTRCPENAKRPPERKGTDPDVAAAVRSALGEWDAAQRSGAASGQTAAV
ncbi:hypothetical protein ACGFYQ_39840 [Streptomyces sp. NPDC048258]